MLEDLQLSLEYCPRFSVSVRKQQFSALPLSTHYTTDSWSSGRTPLPWSWDHPIPFQELCRHCVLDDTLR